VLTSGPSEAEAANRVGELAREALPADLRQHVARCGEFALDEPHVFAIMFVTPRARARTFPADFEARRSAAFSLLADRVADAIAAGDLREDAATDVALTLWAHAHGLVLLQRAGRFGHQLAPYRRAFDRSLDRLVAGLAAR